MPQSWQITQARALQTRGVWNLADSFTVGGLSYDHHEDFLTELGDAATTAETNDNLLDTADGVLRTEYAFFQSMNVAIAARLDSEVEDADPLQRDVDEIRSAPSSRAAIDERTLKTVSCWQKVNAARAAAVPPLPAITVRSTAVAAYDTRWKALPAKRQTRENAAGVWRTSASLLRAVDRKLDRLNKAWYQAWASEFPPGTPEGDALAGVDTESRGSLPQVLEIAAIVQQGLSLRVTYVPGTGAHATVLNLQYLVEGENADFQTLPATVSTGNLIGPFTQGQIVRIRTDVGNSRDPSELSAEQAVTVGPSV
ncbi:MAG: hypothetical protein V4689_03775 [Verrucomicrobiota bacterium]